MENRGEKGIHMNSHLSNFDDQSALSQEVSQGLIFLTLKKESDYSHQWCPFFSFFIGFLLFY